MRICDILGVEPNEVFEFGGVNFYINDDGYLCEKSSDGLEIHCCSNILISMVENKNAIKRKINFTDDELAFIRFLKQQGIGNIRKVNGFLYFGKKSFERYWNADFRAEEMLLKFLRSLPHGDCNVDLDGVDA